MVNVAVAVHVGSCSREPTAIDDAGVVQGVGIDDVAIIHESREHTEVCGVATGKEKGCAGSRERGEFLFAPAVSDVGSAYQAGCGGADSPAL